MAIARPPAVMSPVAQIRAGVDALVAAGSSGLSDAELGSLVLELRREMDRQDAVFAQAVRAAHTQGVGASDGAASTAAWVTFTSTAARRSARSIWTAA